MSKSKKEKRVNTWEEKYTPRIIPGVKQGFALGFPNDYFCGMSNLGLQVIYSAINSREDTACERFFLEKNRSADSPLCTLETGRPVRDFPLIGISLSFEMDYFNVVALLEDIAIPVFASARDDGHPLVICGGACATANPEPVADFFDLVVVGEGEEVINEILDCYYDCQTAQLTRREILQRLSLITGVYVPAIFAQENQDIYVVQPVLRRIKKDFEVSAPASSAIVAANTEFSSMFLLEIARGCGRHCRFCMAGYCTRPPRAASLELLKLTLERPRIDRLRVGLVGCAVSDYPHIDELCEYLLANDIDFSVASLRADSVTDTTLRALAACGHRTVTFAPEAGSERLRAVINKTITREQLLTTIERTANAGIPNIRLYFMIGLPFEESDDIQAIVDLSKEALRIIRSTTPRGRLTLSVNPFVPKPHTPFQRLPFTETRTLQQRYDYLKTALGKIAGIELKTEDLRQAAIQAMLARGGRDLAPLIVDAARLGGFKAWKHVLKMNAIDGDKLLKGFSQTEKLPWEHIKSGVDDNFFAMERFAASEEKYTAACSPGCTKCGVCK